MIQNSFQCSVLYLLAKEISKDQIWEIFLEAFKISDILPTSYWAESDK